METPETTHLASLNGDLLGRIVELANCLHTAHALPLASRGLLSQLRDTRPPLRVRGSVQTVLDIERGRIYRVTAFTLTPPLSPLPNEGTPDLRKLAAAACEHLVSLDLSVNDMSALDLHALATCKQLRSLAIFGCNTNCVLDVKPLAWCTTLRDLTLSHIGGSGRQHFWPRTALTDEDSRAHVTLRRHEGRQVGATWGLDHLLDTLENLLVRLVHTTAGPFCGRMNRVTVVPRSNQTDIKKAHSGAARGHALVHDYCRVCTECANCTGYGSACVGHEGKDRRRDRGGPCGCGSGDAGCNACGRCAICCLASPCSSR